MRMKIFKDGTVYALGNIASAAVPFVLLPILTRALTPEQYGHVVSFSLMVMLATPFAGLSVQNAVGVSWFTRSREDIPAIVASSLILAFSSTVLTAAVLALCLAITSESVAHLSPTWVACAALTAGANVIFQCRQALWQSQQQTAAYVVLQFANTGLNLTLSLAGVFILQLGAEGRNGGIVLSSCVMALVAVLLLYWRGSLKWQVCRGDFKALLWLGAPLIPHVLGGVLIATVDRWIVSAQLGPEALGAYGACAQLAMVMALLVDAFAKAYSPWLYERLGSGDPRDKYRAVGAVYLAVPFLAASVGLAGFFLYMMSGVLLGPNYNVMSNSLLPWFMLGSGLAGTYFCVTNLFFFSGQTALLSAITASAACVGALVTWVLVKTFGVVGAAMGYAATQGILAILITAVAFNRFDLPWTRPRDAVASLWAYFVKPSDFLGALER